MDLDLNAMALFVRVAEHSSFSEAARQHGVPISTVSRKISGLEKTLDVRLLERSTRKLRLTDLGQEYYEYCRRGLEEFEIGTLMINERQTDVSGTLKLSIPPSLADILVIPLVRAFQDIYTKVIVKIQVTERHDDFIEKGVDLAFRVGNLKDSSLIARQLFSYRHMLVASADYLAHYGTPSHPSELLEHQLITFGDWYSNVNWELKQKQHIHKLKAEGTLIINDHGGILSAAEAGQGIAESPAIICGSALQQGRLVEVLPDWHFEPVSISAVYLSNHNLSRTVRLFKDFCVERINEFVPFTDL